jgi:uncharacterized protein YjbI with pentapeptide repeats
MTPDMAAQHLTMLQANGTSTLASSPSQPSRKTSRRERFVSWAGLKGKTPWDWLSVVLIPIILAVYALITTLNMAEQQNIIASQQTAAMQQQNEIADEQLKSNILWQYTSTIQDLILDKGLLQSKSGDNVRTIATTQTALALEQLDGGRKAHLLLFIYRSKLIDIDYPIIDLGFADLSRASLIGAYLYRANLEGVYLYRAYLGGASLGGANLYEAYLEGADLEGADLRGANLSLAYLGGADLRGANLREANLSLAYLGGADLSGATVTDEQLKQAESLQGAIMPDGSEHP